MAYPRKPDPFKTCAQCGKKLERKRFNGTLESMNVFLRRRYCDRECMGKAFVNNTNPNSHYLKRFRKNACEKCGSGSQLHVHHKDEDRTNNSPSNLQTLCASCHLKWHWANGKKPRAIAEPFCRVCGKAAYRSGLCSTHRTRQRKYGSPYLTKIATGHGWLLVEDRG